MLCSSGSLMTFESTSRTTELFADFPRGRWLVSESADSVKTYKQDELCRRTHRDPGRYRADWTWDTRN